MCRRRVFCNRVKCDRCQTNKPGWRRGTKGGGGGGRARASAAAPRLGAQEANGGNEEAESAQGGGRTGERPRLTTANRMFARSIAGLGTKPGARSDSPRGQGKH